MELNNRTALVTGGTAGIGRACAMLLAGEGASVVITGRDPERGKAAAADLGRRVRYVQADMSDAESVKSLVQQVGDVDILVNNAASFPGALTVDQDVPAFEKTFDTNVRGSYFLAAGLVPGMLERGRGSIVNVTSMVAVKGVPGASVYSSSKAAVESLTRTWAVEFGSRGVRVNSVAPGPTKTEGVEAEWGDTN
jgi:NAD(P)-dependent dehydrogenase (short-subunit alcohol dehydrogenase family)